MAQVVRCEPFTAEHALANAAEVSGNVALCIRGECGFVDKARAAQSAGAVSHERWLLLLLAMRAPPTRARAT